MSGSTFVPNGKARPKRGRLILVVFSVAILASLAALVAIWQKRPSLDWGQRLASEQLVKFANDPKSVEFVEWRPTVKAEPWAYGILSDSATYVVVRSKNANGALEVVPKLAYFHKGKLVTIIDNPLQMEVDQIYNESRLVVDPLADKLNEAARGVPRP